MQCRLVGSDWEGLATRCRGEMPPRDATTWRGRREGERERERERGKGEGIIMEGSVRHQTQPLQTCTSVPPTVPLGVGGSRRW